MNYSDIPISAWIFIVLISNFSLVTFNLFLIGFVSMGWEKQYCYGLGSWYMAICSLCITLWMVIGSVIGDIPTNSPGLIIFFGVVGLIMAYAFHNQYRDKVRNLFK